MPQCPSCNADLSQENVQAGNCPACGNSLLNSSATMVPGDEAHAVEEDLYATETIAEAPMPDDSMKTLSEREDAGTTLSLRDLSQEELEVFRQTITDVHPSVLDELRGTETLTEQSVEELENVETLVAEPSDEDSDGGGASVETIVQDIPEDQRNVDTITESQLAGAASEMQTLPTASEEFATGDENETQTIEDSPGAADAAAQTLAETSSGTDSDLTGLADLGLSSHDGVSSEIDTLAEDSADAAQEADLAKTVSDQSDSDEMPTVATDIPDDSDEAATIGSGAGTLDSDAVDSARRKSAGRQATQVIDETKLVIQEREVVDAKQAQEIPADFELIEKLGEGGMGLVYKGTQASVNREVAIKLIKKRIASNPKQRGNFLTEAVVTSDLDHPNIVPIYDLGTDRSNALFYAMKFVEGTPWQEAIKQKSLNENLDILMKVADAIAFAHSRGVVHRDLKPENIMLGEFGEVLVMDWGLAMPVEGFAKTDSIQPVKNLGFTPAYASPELVKGPIAAIGTHSDVYLLGAMLFQALTKKPPHTGKNVLVCLKAASQNIIRKRTGDTGGALMDIAMKAMQTEPSDRHDSVDAFQGAIREYRSHLQSIDMSDRAQEDLQRARSTSEYRDFGKAQNLFEEAIKMWPENSKAHVGLSAAQLAYAQKAKDNGDYDLGAGLLNIDESEHAQLHQEITVAKAERDARQERVKTLTRFAIGLAAMLFVVISGAFFYSNQQRQIAVTAQLAAEKAEKEEAVQRQKADENAAEAKKNEKIAIAAGKKETEAKDAAIKAQELETVAKNDAIKAQKEEARQRKLAVDAAKAETIAKVAAQKAQKKEEVQRKIAEDAAAAETIAKVAAQKAQKKEAEQRKIAENLAIAEEKAKLLAIEAERKAEYEHYVAEIGLADEKIRTNAFDAARTSLESLKDSEHRGWEYSRLLYVSQLGLETAAQAEVNDVAYSPDGKVFVTGRRDGVASIWESSAQLDTRPKELRAMEHGSPIQAVAIYSDGRNRIVATAASDHLVKIWNAQSGMLMGTLKGHTRPVLAVTFSPDGNWLLTGSSDKTARLWDLKSGRQLAQCLHYEPVHDVAFNPDADRIVTATASYDEKGGQAMVWKVVKAAAGLSFRSETEFIEHGFQGLGDEQRRLGAVYAVAFRKYNDQEYIISGGADGRILVWKPNVSSARDIAREVLLQFKNESAAKSMKKSERNLGRQQFGILFDPDLSVEDAHAGRIRSLNVSSTGQQLISGSDDFTVKVWDFETRQLVKKLRGHRGFVTGCAFQPNDPLQIVSVSHDKSIRTWNVSKYAEERVLADKDVDLKGHNEAVLTAAFDPTGRFVVTASRDHTAKIWDVTTGEGKQLADQLAQTLEEGHELSATTILHLPLRGASHTRTLLTGAMDDTMRLWDVGRGVELSRIEGTGRVEIVGAVSPEGDWLLTGGSDHVVKLWDVHDVRDPQLAKSFKEHASNVTAVAVSPNGSLLFSADERGFGFLWGKDTAETDEPLRLVSNQGRAHLERITAAHFLSDSRLLTSSEDQRLVLWDVRTLEPLHAITIEDGVVNSMALTPNRQHVLALTTKESEKRFQLRLFRVGESISQLGDARDIPEEIVYSVALSPNDGQFALTSGSNRDGSASVVRRWLVKPDSLQDQTEYLGADQDIASLRSAIYSPDGSRVYTLEGRYARQWDANTRIENASFRSHQAVVSAGFSSDGQYIVTGSQDRSFKIWSVGTGKAIKKHIDAHGDAITSVSFGQETNPRQLLTAGKDGKAKVWAWDPVRKQVSEKPVVVLSHDRDVNGAAFSSNGTHVLTACDDGAARIWNLQDQTSKQFQHADSPVTCAAYSADGKYVITGGEDKIAVIWNAATGDRMVHEGRPLELQGHSQLITSVAFSPDGKRVITGSQDATAKIWDAKTGSELLTLRGHRGSVTSVAFSSVNGKPKYALTGSADNTARIWLTSDADQPVAAMPKSKLRRFVRN